MNVAMYLRISKDDQDDGLAVERQEKDCRALVKSRGWTVAEPVYEDNSRSAYNGTRPAWDRMLSDLDAGKVEAVVAWANDRLYRRVRDQLDLMERGKPIVTVRDGEVDPNTAEGKMRMTILASVAAFESERKAERHQAKHEQIADAGTWPGGRVPFGYRLPKDGPKVLQVEPNEAKMLRDAAAAILDGATLHSVADRLGKDPRTARRSLMNEAIAGRRMYKGREMRARWDPILDVRTWRKVCAVLSDPARTTPGPRPRYLLTGLVVCGTCGSNLKGHPQRGSKAYSCLNKGCDQWAQSLAEPLDLHVLNEAAGRKAAVTTVEDPTAVPESAQLDALDDQMEALAESDIDPEAYDRRYRALKRKREALEAKVAKRAVKVETPVHALVEGREREWLDRTVERVVLRPAGRSRYVPIASRVRIEWR